MLTIRLEEFRKNMEAHLNRVSKNSETLHIRQNGKYDVVMMSLDEYNAFLTTNHELTSKKNELRLDAAIQKFKEGKSFSRNLAEENAPQP